MFSRNRNQFVCFVDRAWKDSSTDDVLPPTQKQGIIICVPTTIYLIQRIQAQTHAHVHTHARAHARPHTHIHTHARARARARAWQMTKEMTKTAITPFSVVVIVVVVVVIIIIIILNVIMNTLWDDRGLTLTGCVSAPHVVLHNLSPEATCVWPVPCIKAQEKNYARRMHCDTHHLRPGLFGFESSHHKTMESRSEAR